MKIETEIGCIHCGMRCQVEVLHDEDTVLDWAGNNCSRGEEHAIKQLGLPYRMLKTYLKVTGGKVAAVKAQSVERVEETRIESLMKEIYAQPISAPVRKSERVQVAGIVFETLEAVQEK